MSGACPGASLRLAGSRRDGRPFDLPRRHGSDKGGGSMRLFRAASQGLQRAAVRRLVFEDHGGEKTFLARRTFAGPHVLDQVDVAIDGWPKGAPLRIAVLADLHLGSHAGDVPRLVGIVEEVNALAPDLVLMPGDFLNVMPFGGGHIPPERVAALLAPLSAPLCVHAVLGNHDHDFGAGRVEASLSAHGIEVHENRRRELRHHGAAIDLVGLTDARGGAPDLSLLAGLSPQRPALVLTHDPVLFRRMPAGPHLMICGHTHGGQIRLPLIGVVTNASEAPLRWTSGLVEERGARLYVSAGLGTTGLPLRIGVPPEIGLLTVAAAED